MGATLVTGEVIRVGCLGGGCFIFPPLKVAMESLLPPEERWAAAAWDECCCLVEWRLDMEVVASFWELLTCYFALLLELLMICVPIVV